MSSHRHRRTRARAAFTLFEVMVALLIFISVMTLVMNSLVSVTQYSTQETRQSDMVIQGRETARLITNDLANSSWLYDFSQANSQIITTPFPNTLGYSPPVPYQNNPLLPWVWIDPSNNIITTSTTVAGVTTTTSLPTGHPEWEKDTLEYLKVRTSDRIAYSPTDERYEIINQWNPATSSFSNVSTLDTFAAAPTSPFLIVNDNYPAAAGSNDVYLSHVWEAGRTGTSKSATPNPFTPLTFNQNQNPAFLRHYHLEVIKVGARTDNPKLQLGTLVRTYWNGNGSSLPSAGNDTAAGNTSQSPGWNPDDQQILLYNVESFVVRTVYQPLSNNIPLQTNQISVTIVIQEPTAQPGVYLPQTINFITAMRSLAQ